MTTTPSQNKDRKKRYSGNSGKKNDYSGESRERKEKEATTGQKTTRK